MFEMINQKVPHKNIANSKSVKNDNIDTRAVVVFYYSILVRVVYNASISIDYF